jgi:DNA invertase Pin-like site-specific DNA recombinase
MAKALIGYARCSTDKQDLAAQRAALIELGVDPKRIYTDHGLTGTNRLRPGSTRPWLPSAGATPW